MMTQYCNMKGTKPPYGHHKFQEKISYVLIDPIHKWPRRGDCTSANNRKRTLSATKIKASSMANASPRTIKGRKSCVEPITSSLKKCLDPSLEHLPLVVPGKNTTQICQLHCFTARKTVKEKNITDGARAIVMRCFTCGVNICLPCFFLFHKTSYLEEAIRNIM